jgi:hypothetical protein
MKRNKERKEQMFSLVEELHQTTLTRKEFCSQNSLTLSCLYYWQKKHRQQIFKDQPGFIRVRPGNGHGSWQSTCQPIILTYPNGVSLQLPESTPIPVIGSLLRLA